ncbi:hypothetical protein, partial [Enterobacter cloacae complex sp. 2DZ2F20B]|uniref:hypothetical protein n=1 Tax=Enterobacter cloacae complex sp. 2DZ2F20B TaxID=2511993 RepID=UPI001CA509B0
MHEHLIIVGDFNVPSFSSNSHSNCHKTLILKQFCNVVQLSQFNSIPNSNNRLLDLFFSNPNTTALVSHCTPPLISEDKHHPALHVNFNFAMPIITSKFPLAKKLRYNFRKANFLK